jgi:hypothetical protein
MANIHTIKIMHIISIMYNVFNKVSFNLISFVVFSGTPSQEVLKDSVYELLLINKVIKYYIYTLREPTSETEED